MKGKSLLALLGMVVAVLLPREGFSQSRIVFPPDKALLTGPGLIEVIGVNRAEKASSLTLKTKQDQQSYPLTVKGLFKVKVQLRPGENVIEVGDKRHTVRLEAERSSGSEGGFSPPDTHAVDNSCDDCHAISGTEVKLNDKVPALCMNCHDGVGKDKDGRNPATVHPPVDEGDCLACHPFHALRLSKLPAAAKRAVCFGCHDDFTEGGKARMHAPVGKGECTGCHLVHGGPGKKLLPATGLKLCLLCHKDPTLTPEGKAWNVGHPAMDDGCPNCHLPHASKAKRLLKKPQASLCFDCHDNFMPEGSKLLRHSPVDEGECSACHRPHGSDTKKLLAAEGMALCGRCHDDPSKGPDGKAWPVPHPALDDGCQGCHLPHVSEAAKLLKKAQAPLCFDCHDAFPKGADGKPMFAHRPVAQGACAGCHAPHGSGTKKILLANPAKELCLRCHKDPSQTSEGREWAVPHAALDDGCPACHLPHVSAVPKLLPKAPAQLCAGCHENKNVNGAGQAWTEGHPPVRNGLCLSCHAPHGAPAKALLPKPVLELCRDCHKEIHANHTAAEIDPDTGQPVSGKATLPQNFPVRRRDGALVCTGCHLPHGSDNPKLWNREETFFCNACHVKY